MDYRQWQEKKKRSDNIWTALIVAAFILGMWPAGVVLIILKAMDKLPVLGTGKTSPQTVEQWRQQFTQTMGQAAQSARQTAQNMGQAAQNARYSAQNAAYAPPKPQSRRKQSKKKDKLTFGARMFTAGIVLLILGVLMVLSATPYDASFWELWREFAFGGSFLVGGAALTILGYKRRRRSRRLRQYDDMIDPKCGWLSIHEMADRMGVPYKQLCDDLQRMVELDVWKTAWIDRSRGRLMFTPFEHQEEKQETKKKNMTHAEQVLRQIRADNDLIADVEVSKKIDRIETLTGRIFAYLEKHPESASELNTFMDYYLPQTMKMLEYYARLEHVDTEQARQARARGADYLGVGAVFATGTKADAVGVAHETVKAICHAVDIPAVAIGGITAENVSLLRGNGLAGIATVSAIFGAADIEAATRALHQLTKEMVNQE